MTAWQLKDLVSLEMPSKISKGTDLYVKMMLIFPTLLSATGQPFISKALGLTLGKNIKEVCERGEMNGPVDLLCSF